MVLIIKGLVDIYICLRPVWMTSAGSATVIYVNVTLEVPTQGHHVGLDG